MSPPTAVLSSSAVDGDGKGHGGGLPSAPRSSRWSTVQAAIVPNLVVAARRGEEKLFPDHGGGASRSFGRTASGARLARPASAAALRDSIRPMNLAAALLAEDAYF